MPDFNRTEASAAPVNAAINAVLDNGAGADGEKTRDYLGASAVGHPCLRKIQYDWMCDPQHAPRTRDIFARGHFFEEQRLERQIQKYNELAIRCEGTAREEQDYLMRLWHWKACMWDWDAPRFGDQLERATKLGIYSPRL